MILGPIATGAGLLWLKPDQFRKILVSGIALLVCGGVLALALPGIFLGFLYTLEIKFRKSPFDLSASHHAHQELVRGMTMPHQP